MLVGFDLIIYNRRIRSVRCLCSRLDNLKCVELLISSLCVLFLVILLFHFY